MKKKVLPKVAQANGDKGLLLTSNDSASAEMRRGLTVLNTIEHIVWTRPGAWSGAAKGTLQEVVDLLAVAKEPFRRVEKALREEGGFQ